jgi:hypothetical protein
MFLRHDSILQAQQLICQTHQLQLGQQHMATPVGQHADDQCPFWVASFGSSQLRNCPKVDESVNLDPKISFFPTR